MKLDWTKPRFLKSANALAGYPLIKDDRGHFLQEVAVAGRSNVGKSTLLNDLFRAKNLVKTSATPGKTQLLNFFTVDDLLSFVDLPGYGFAKVPLSVQKSWGPMIQEYLATRASLKLILFLFDIRRVPSEEDLELMEWIAKAGKGVILVLTKIDKVTLNEKNANTAKILKAFDVPNIHFVHYSAHKNVGRDVLIKLLNEAFSEEGE